MKNARVLIVDDDPTLLDALAEAVRLRVRGVEVEVCDSAPAALERISATKFDAIVADIKMPGMDGLELLARIRELRPGTPTLLITGHGEHDLAVRALRGGAYDYVQKPIDREYFVGSLSHAIELHRRSRQLAKQTSGLERRARDLEACLEERTRQLRELYQREAMARAELDKMNQDLEEAQSRREELISMIAHDLGTPLTTLKGYVEILGRVSSPDALQERARAIIISETSRMARLIQDLVDASRLPTGKFEVQLGACDLVGIARAQVELARTRSQRHTLVLEAPELLPMQADRDRMAQVLANLLTNAVTHTSEGEIVMRLWVEDGQARISLRDTGPGIPADSLDTIFEPHVRLAGTGAGERPKGAGLGLSIARAIVGAHGGRIWAESAPGQGATFNVSLPLPSPAKGKEGVSGVGAAYPGVGQLSSSTS